MSLIIKFLINSHFTCIVFKGIVVGSRTEKCVKPLIRPSRYSFCQFVGEADDVDNHFGEGTE